MTSALRFTRGCRGLTLVEVLVALCLLGITTTMLGTALARSVSAVSDSRLDLEAAAAELNRVESLRVSAADSCPAPGSGSGRPMPGLSERWHTVRLPAALDLVDSVVPNDPARHPLRVLSVRLTCP